jgi:beta-phosphoglucomutase-like phosphatase (HAD superfamily)
MPIDAVIFDCDRTLVDSLPLATEVLVEYLADLGLTLSERDAAAQRAYPAWALRHCAVAPAG